MKLLNIFINGSPHYAVWDIRADEILPFGQGARGLAAATEFINLLDLAMHAAGLAGFAH